MKIEEALSLAQQLDENVELIARVKELEDINDKVNVRYFRVLDDKADLQRKLEVARDALNLYAYAYYPEGKPYKVDGVECTFSNDVLEIGSNPAKQALTATDTIQKITVIKEGSIVFEDGRFEMRDWDINANGAAFTQQEYLALVLEYLAAKARGQDTTQKEAGEG